MQKLSLERAIGRAIVTDSLIAEALAGFAASERRRPANAAAYMVMLGLEALRWLEFHRAGAAGARWRRGPALKAFLAREDALERMASGLWPDRSALVPARRRSPSRAATNESTQAPNVVPFRRRRQALHVRAQDARPAPASTSPAG